MDAPPYWPALPPVRNDRYQRPFGLNPAWSVREVLWARRTRLPSTDSDEWFVLTHPRATVSVRKPEVDLTDACPVCASGWKQVGPLRLPPSALPRRGMAMTDDNDLLLREDAVTALDGCTQGLNLTPVLGTDGSVLPWMQAVPLTELSPVVDASNNGYSTDLQCIRCQRDGFFDGARPTPLYEPSALAAVPATYRFIGSAERLGVSSGKRLVAARVFARREAAQRLLAAVGHPNLTVQPLRVRSRR